MKCPLCGRILGEGRNKWGCGGLEFRKTLIDNKWIFICKICWRKREGKS